MLWFYRTVLLGSSHFPLDLIPEMTSERCVVHPSTLRLFWKDKHWLSASFASRGLVLTTCHFYLHFEQILYIIRLCFFFVLQDDDEDDKQEEDGLMSIPSEDDRSPPKDDVANLDKDWRQFFQFWPVAAECSMWRVSSLNLLWLYVAHSFSRNSGTTWESRMNYCNSRNAEAFAYRLTLQVVPDCCGYGF